MHDVQYCTSMPKSDCDPCDLITSAEAREILGGRRLEPYYRRAETARIKPVMRAGSGSRSPLLFNRTDVERLRDEIAAKLNDQLEQVKGGSTGD